MSNKTALLQNLVTFRNSQGDSARGTLLKLERSTAVFEVYNPYSIVQLSEVLQDLTIRRGDRIIYRGRAVVSNLVNTGLMLIVSTALAGSMPLPVVRADQSVRLEDEAEDFIREWLHSQTIQLGYRLAVNQFRSFLSELNQWIEQLDAMAGQQLLKDCATNEAYFERAAPIVDKLRQLNETLESEARRVPEGDVAVHKHFMQKELHPLIMNSPFLHRTFSKPLGYAGDYEMMNMIHRVAPEGGSVYARLLNAVYVRQPIAISVMNRAAMLRSRLEAESERMRRADAPFRVASIGCGPAVEVQKFIRAGLGAGCAFDLLDFNEDTLGFAQKEIMRAIDDAGIAPQVNYLHKSVHFLLKSAVAKGDEFPSGSYDFVYSAGLFDYLSDKVCARLIRLFYSWLRADGLLLVTNIHPANPNRCTLEHGLEWHLIHRDEEQMLSLVPGLGRQHAFTDETGINLTLEIRRLDSGGH